MPTANPPGRTLWLMAAIVLVGLNLRPSMAAVGPLLNAMRGEIALSFGAVSLLTALPVLTLGLGMFFGLGIARRVGEWRSVALALLLIGAASALRLPDAQPGRSLLRYPRTWLLVLFFGLGTACYTCVLAWLAPYYLEQGWSAQESGLLLGFLTAMEVLSGLLAPALASRSRDRRPVLVGLTALMLAGFLGLAWAPASLPLLWALCLGLGIGGLFPMGLIVCLDHFDAPQRAGQLAALVQGAGYLIAGVSPWIAGLLRDSLGSFTGAWLGLATVAALLLGLGLRFDPRRYAALFAERQARGVGAESLR